MGSKEKVKLKIKAFWYSSFEISYFQTNFLHAMAVLGYLSKLKRGLGLAFGAHFLHDFSKDDVPYLILYLWTKFQCHTFFLLKISEKMCY